MQNADVHPPPDIAETLRGWTTLLTQPQVVTDHMIRNSVTKIIVNLI